MRCSRCGEQSEKAHCEECRKELDVWVKDKTVHVIPPRKGEYRPRSKGVHAVRLAEV